MPHAHAQPPSVRPVRGLHAAAAGFDVDAAAPVSPLPAPAAPRLPPLAGAGLTLAKFAFAILAAVLLLLIGALAYQEIRVGELLAEAYRAIGGIAVPDPSAEQIKARQEFLQTYNEAVNAAREFWSAMAQMILLNLLLPVISALLGYVFGSSQAGR
jgi:hypothetical protein